MVSNGWHHPVLEAVVELYDAALADRVAASLTSVLQYSSGPALDEEISDVERLLPAAQRAAYRTAVERLAHRFWPAPQLSSRSLDEGPRDRFHSYDDEDQRSPDAPLAELPGKVVRIWWLTESHIHDPDRLLHAAKATGRFHPEGENTDQDIVQAMACVLDDDDRGFPGADRICNQYVGEVLNSSTDELAMFRQVTLPEFQTGWAQP